AGLVVHAGVEEYVVHHGFQGRAAHVLGQAAVASPVVRDGAAAVRDDEFQGGKVAEQVGLDELHEGGGVAVQVMGAGEVEVGVAGATGVDHGGHVQFDHFFEQRIP